MDKMRFAPVLIFFLCLLHNISGSASATKITITSSCKDTIWLAIVSKPGSPELPKSMTGFALKPGESKTVTAPANWTGTLWGRTYCSRNSTTGKITCGTGDCGSNAVECPGGSPTPAATTLADFTPKGVGGEYTYSVSLVKGFNLPMTVVPRGNNGGKNCRATGCAVDQNKECPKEVQVIGHDNEVIGCNSACEAFKESQDHYCGRSSTYSDHFKRFCPSVKVFEGDKTNSLFECTSVDHYNVKFCTSSLRSSPPPFKSNPFSASPPEVYNPPGEAELTDNNHGATPLVIKIVAAILGITGSGILTLLGHTIWSLYHRDHNCPFCNYPRLIIFQCCNHCSIFYCCNSSPSDPDDHDQHHQYGSSTSAKHDLHFPKQTKQIISMENIKV